MITELEAYKAVLENAAYGIELNMNDTFYYACGDSETLNNDDAITLIPIIQRYGDIALIAYCSIKRGGALPIRIRDGFYEARSEIQNLADNGDILFSEYYDMQEIRKEMINFDGQSSSWRHFSDRFINIVNKEPKFSRCVIHVARLKDGTFAVGRSIAETQTRLKRKYDRKKERNK